MNNQSANLPNTRAPEPVNSFTALDESRRELLAFLAGDRSSREDRAHPAHSQSKHTRFDPTGTAPSWREALASGDGADHTDWVHLLKVGAETWWRNHPLSVGVAIVSPIATRYVKQKPATALALAAAAGAILVLIRPWRLLSAGSFGTLGTLGTLSTVSANVARSSGLPVAAMAVLTAFIQNSRKSNP